MKEYLVYKSVVLTIEYVNGMRFDQIWSVWQTTRQANKHILVLFYLLPLYYYTLYLLQYTSTICIYEYTSTAFIEYAESKSWALTSKPTTLVTYHRNHFHLHFSVRV